MSAWIIPAAAIMYLSALTAPLPDPQETASPQDETRVLDEIISEGYVPPELAPKTGTFLFRPIIYPGIGNNGSIIRRVDFFFSPVVQTKDGQATLYKEQDRQRYRVSINVPQVNPTGTRFRQSRNDQRIDLGTRELNLPGGTYILSEVRYSFLQRRRGGGFLGVASGSGPVLNSGLRTRSYCLTEQTYAFDIENGKQHFLGGMAINPLPQNQARWKDYRPIVGVDNNLKHVSGIPADELEAIKPLEFDLLSFDAEPGLCGNRRYKTAALVD